MQGMQVGRTQPERDCFDNGYQTLLGFLYIKLHEGCIAGCTGSLRVGCQLRAVLLVLGPEGLG